MADQAWSEVHALVETPGFKHGTETATVELTAIQETAFSHFRAFADTADWRVRDHGVRSVLFFHNGNRLYVTETFAQLRQLVKLKN